MENEKSHRQALECVRKLIREAFELHLQAAEKELQWEAEIKKDIRRILTILTIPKFSEKSGYPCFFNLSSLSLYWEASAFADNNKKTHYLSSDPRTSRRSEVSENGNLATNFANTSLFL